jgi:hypothetical protein
LKEGGGGLLVFDWDSYRWWVQTIPSKQGRGHFVTLQTKNVNRLLPRGKILAINSHPLSYTHSLKELNALKSKLMRFYERRLEMYKMWRNEA